MIFGYQENGSTVVVGADRKEELIAFLEAMPKVSEPLFSNFVQLNMDGLDEPVWLFQHKNQEEADKFIETNWIYITESHKAAKFQNRMIERANNPDDYDPRPLGLIYGLPMRDLLAEIEEQKAQQAATDNPTPVDLSLSIPDPKHIIYIRVNVENQKTSVVEPIVSDFAEYIAIMRDDKDGCWLATHLQIYADDIIKKLTDLGMKANSYIINHRGEQILPGGFRIVEKLDTKDMPRPWRIGREDEWKNLPEADRKKNRIRGDELIFDGNSTEYGSRVYIVPTEYYMEHRTLFPESLDIGHLIPKSFWEVSPGIYETKMYREWDRLSLELMKNGMTENITIRMFVED